MGFTLLVDNYDSFTWNIYADIATLKGNPLVRRNDKISIQDVQVRAVQACASLAGYEGGHNNDLRSRSACSLH
jgi:anthranilate synthase/indole-3-glycerol phosphate synthase/phosphoribosylanthranilate isomerase